MCLFWAIIFIPQISKSGINASPYSLNEHIIASAADPKLVGPENLCLVFGNVIGTYSAGGEDGDVYDWEITNSSGTVIFGRSGGIQLETIQVIFPETGNYKVSLKVRRGTNSGFYQEELTVVVQMGPELALKSDYLLCAGVPTNLTAINPATSNISDFSFEWKDLGGNVIGTGNELLAYSEGFYLVELFQTDASGVRSCIINGTTFVGLPVDFQIVPSSTTVCEGGSINFELDTPLSGDWFVQKDFTGGKTKVGSGFAIDIAADNLSGPGLYLVTFQTIIPEYPACVSEKVIGFEILERPGVTVTVLNEPDDCASQTGAFKVIVDSDIDALFIPELNVVEGPISAGEERTFSNLGPQVYSVVIEKNGCQITQLVVLEAQISPLSTTPTVTTQNETCDAEGIKNGVVTIDLGTNITEGEYRVLTVGRGEKSKGVIPADGKTSFNLPSGSYLIEMKVEGCTYPIQPITIEKAAQVEFTVPSSLNICETFTLKPETNQNLIFTITLPDGSTETINSGEDFSFNVAGEYSILGVGQGDYASLCPKKLNFTTTITSAISFFPVLSIEKCFDPIKYEIDLQGIPIEDASIRWLNDQGEIVGRGQLFFPPKLGTFSLSIQPLKSGFCPLEPVEFEVLDPNIPIPMELEATKICPDPTLGTVSLITDEEEISLTEWFFFNENDQRLKLDEYDGLFEIEVTNPGSYEVVAYNLLGCEIGREFLLVEESELVTSPNFESAYGVCSEGKKGPVLDPGLFKEYYWYLGEKLVSTNPQFSPQKVGQYTLSVITEDGCEFRSSFRTFETCAFSYVFPTAMVLGDSERNFEVWVDEGIATVELFIINRQGTLIHHDQSNEILFEEPLFIWDGKVSGDYIPAGTYTVVLVGKNPLFNFEEKITQSLLVIE